MLALSVGMAVFFALSVLLAGMRGEGRSVQGFMLVMTVVFSALVVLLMLTG